jgi:hypothetical protein
MNDVIDLETIYRQEKPRWMKTEAPKKGFREYVADSAVLDRDCRGCLI